MRIVHDLEGIGTLPSPLSLTIGIFDGVHLGHQALLNRLHARKGESLVLTFSRTPREVLHQKKVSYLTTLSHRLELLKRIGITTTLVIPFTPDFAKQSAHTFLSHFKKIIPFSHLILGHDATIGYARQGGAPQLLSLATTLDFTLEYVAPVQAEEVTISSSEIRKLIQSGNLELTSRFLGRPYSIFGAVKPGKGKGRTLGFQTANLSVTDLCLPPFGVYIVQAIVRSNVHPAIANLGYAPTLHQQRAPLLEVHLLDCQEECYHENMEVIFLKYLRAERSFLTAHSLKKQIQKDISQAHRFFNNKSFEII